MSILVITTGGTLAALPVEKGVKRPPKIRTMPPSSEDPVCEFVKKNFSPSEVRLISLEPRDSHHIDDEYRAIVLQTIRDAPETKIVITHGTDKIISTAEYLHRCVTEHSVFEEKTIVLTGGMEPLQDGPDGYLNLKFSLGKISAMKAGIYIVLCDYQVAQTQSGWKPRLYPFEPGRYEKFYDPEDSRRDRIRMKE